MVGATEPSGTQRAEQRLATEQTLLDAAAEVIAERGISGASFTIISERAGTSRTLPTHHFGAKDQLVARVAERAQSQVSDAMLTALEQFQDRGALTGLELIRLLVGTYFEQMEDPTPNERALLVMWGATFPAGASLEGIVDADCRSYEGWAGHIRDGQRDGSIREEINPVASAVVLHGMLRGIAALAITKSNPTDLSEVRGSVDDWIATALAAGNRPKQSRRLDAV